MATALKKKQPLQNIKVVVRIRPLTKQEEEQNVKSILKSHTTRELLMKDKKYTFDRVFKPNASQIDLYLNVVSPLIQDVIAGYNCTVFAYGQTGTGKTYTMTGEKCDLTGNWKKDDNSGIIPRAAFHIFHELSLMSNVEINVKVSYIELYNEEIRDLLSEDECALQMYTDTKGAVSIQGLKEVSVHDSEGVLKLLQRGIVKRQIAPTLMNHQSSRSHTVFTVSVNTRESTATGDDILKAGKINLVDLAGSENIARSGCVAARATELANINRSLLTLGRVIQALADKTQRHVPYRDSKLTRILQDSLGGHTKTVIVSTVSPAHTSHEETTSTLEYATRAKDIKNTPIVNEKLTKHQMIDGLVKEIDRLQKDLDAARSGTGFYVDKENYQRLLDAVMLVTGEQITHEELSQRKADRIRNLEEHMHLRVRQFEETVEQCKQHQQELEIAKAAIKEKDEHLEQERYLAKWYEDQSSDKFREAQSLLKTLTTLSTEKEILLAKLEHQFQINSSNESITNMAVTNVLNLLNEFGKEESEKVKTVDKENSERLTDHLFGLTKELKQRFGEMREIPDRMRQDGCEVALSVEAAISQPSQNLLQVVSEKAVCLDEVFRQYKKQVEDYKTSVPKLAEAYRSKTKNFFEKAVTVIKSSDETVNTVMSESNKKTIAELDLIAKMSTDRNLQDERSLRELESLTAATKMTLRELESLTAATKKSLSEHESLTEAMKKRLQENRIILSQVDSLKEHILSTEKRAQQQMLDAMGDLEELALNSIKSFENCAEVVPHIQEIRNVEVNELVSTVQEFNQNLLQISIELDKTHEKITLDRLSSLERHLAAECARLDAALDDAAGRLSADAAALGGGAARFERSFAAMAEGVRRALVEQIVERNVRARHAGDTPVRQGGVAGGAWGAALREPPAPREALLERFRRAVLPHTAEEGCDSSEDSS